MSEDDWIDIAPAAGPHADNVRRAETSHPLDFYRGRDFAGNYIFSLAAGAGCRELPDPPKLNGINATLERRMPDEARLVLTLQDREQLDIFKALCNHLLSATANLSRGSNDVGLRLVLRRISDWHEMLRRGRSDQLSSLEVIGLTGELLFLRDEILVRMTPADAARAWRGAHRDEQDFAVGLTQFEVKTQLSTADQRLLIASEAQLDTAGSRLFLCHQSVTASPAAAASFTLNSLVDSLMVSFTEAGPQAYSTFEAALDAWGYVRRDDYDQPAWLLTDRRLYDVRQGFPRITAAMLPPGVQRVSYEVLLRACEPFMVDLTDEMNGLFR